MNRICKIFLSKIFCVCLLIYSINYCDAAESVKPNPPKGLNIGSDSVSPPDPLPIPGNESLLSGMNPNKYTIPSGWSLIRVQDFEGEKPLGESWGGWDGSVTTTKPHMGSKSIEGTYGWDQSEVRWSLAGEYTGSFTEIYLSWWEFVDSNALWNDEYFQFQFKVGEGDSFQEVVGDWVWAFDETGELAYNQPRASLYVWCQGIYTKRLSPRSDLVPKGTWHQWEAWFRPNKVGGTDGFLRIYLDGVLYTSAENVRLVGRDMAGAHVYVGGIYTKNIWMTDYPTCSAPNNCSSRPGVGTDLCTNSGGRAGQYFSNPYCSPVDPPLNPWKRYIDDIILMKK